jgi:predicted Rossmann fold flavoprotein
MKDPKTIVVIGGGAAGFFGAIACAQASSDKKVILLEKNRQLLSKVRISGGGRCNVTHACFDPALLVQNYPRGHQALRGPFTRFQPRDTIQWFKERGVELKVEEDGRMFPITDNSETIIRCLMHAAAQANVEVRIESGVEAIKPLAQGFELTLGNGTILSCDRLLVASGSQSKMHPFLESLGHHIVPPVPSLFTFNIPDSPLLELAGVSLPKVHVKISGTDLQQIGPLLLTHWGFSGPAVLKLSAWGARILHEKEYHAILEVNWLPDMSREALSQALNSFKAQNPSKQMASESPLSLPKNLWKKLAAMAGLPLDLRWSYFSKAHQQALQNALLQSTFQIQGKSTFKEEFVTCGGVSLDEVNFKTMESKKCPGLYFAGEVLDIDGVTGGFNFQNAWTTGWIAGNSLAVTN